MRGWGVLMHVRVFGRHAAMIQYTRSAAEPEPDHCAARPPDSKSTTRIGSTVDQKPVQILEEINSVLSVLYLLGYYRVITDRDWNE
jgi:hypothetical protein